MKILIVKTIRIYQYFSRFFMPSCRFIPSCSEYTVLAVKKYGIFKGIILALKRIIRCHPFSKAGEDFLV